jgi:enoyl-CoA hydratase/carnithine racemase
MAEGDFFIGQPEVLFGIMPGGGGTQRLTRLVGTHRSLVAILEGKPFTPEEALDIGAVDEVVPPDQVVSRAIELGEHFGSRSKEAVSSIKRSVYFGGSKSLEEGLHVERTEMLTVLQTDDGQDVMIDYQAATDADGELPIYKPGGYVRALETGSLPGRRSPNGQ